ncbi:uncharacterized protein BT62DRAFT_738935 [Guyanagaster necrorhizus]|uniref:Uncharacterized protein n=1 Tax=Guyanagaster necrorhizus TaxID=856835 RepID=A0A9P8AL90_9AGAR|nr:uncharacterized protein BT62DRAFT_738935 [Guyanagaster necrorhizus MCA 3950]KAG7439386.1 hypothetical protein BT62DRAFT_738935 [Guyanagaster necrorhizus MCA 3950]
MTSTFVPVDLSSFDPAFASSLPQYRHPTHSPRIVELLQTNKPPLSPEQDVLAALMASGDEYLAEVDKKIAATRQLLHFLSTERDQIVSNLSDAKILTHPVRQLGDDVLCEIFSRCVPELDAERSFSSLDPRQAPWTLPSLYIMEESCPSNRSVVVDCSG